jgi:hypothetical protein
MICNYSLWYTEPGNYMVEKEKGSRFTTIVQCRHRLGPFGKIVNCDYNIPMPPGRGGVTCHEINAPFGERAQLQLLIAVVRVVILVLLSKIWQEWQLRTAIMQSLNIVGQKYPALNIFWAVAKPD